jgi:DNA-binding NarL/FixJ family response regulator
VSQQPVIPVIIADLFPPYITGIKKAFKYKECMQLHSAESLQEILDLLEKNKNSCVVLTDALLTESGNCCITEIREKFKDVKIIVLIYILQVPMLKNLIALGASALVSKFTRGTELEEAILHVRQNDEPYYCHRILKILALKHDLPQYVNGKKIALSPQLAEVLLYMIDRMPHTQIADEMDLETGTIDGYCKTVNERIKLAKCKSPLEYGVKMGYFTMEEYLKRISRK